MTEIQFFKDLLNSEIKRITRLCELWEKIASENLPDEINGRILSVIGQSKLLINAKFKQFRELINACISNHFSDSSHITLDDLQGFWDLVNIQIDDINRKFKDLEELKSNQWEIKEITDKTCQSTPIKVKRQFSCEKIQSDAAKLRLAAAKEKYQERMTKKCCENEDFYVN